MTDGVTAPPATVSLPEGIEPGGRFGDWRPPSPAFVVCDVDGTLVGPSADASDEVVAAVDRAQSAGLRVGFATGRMRGAVDALQAQLHARGPHVLHNGAEVRADGRTVAAWTLEPAQIDALLAIAAGRDDLYVEIYPEDGFLASRWDERARPHWGILGREPSGVIRSSADLDGAPVLKATFAVFDRDAVPTLLEAISDAGLLAGAAGSPRTPELLYVNATHPEADKGRALVRAAAHLGVAMSDVVAIGDEANDLSMLAVAGTAIAMGQAADEIRDAAHLVVPAVDAHGVAVALDACLAWR
ncbi:HAD family hydrolase [Nitriliruptor alkaliphilus]|uniref:HAD family hydrolase n=1 Tax=Nitriliruptor alkaliphilus TaxID=427918 RepID=UPI000698CF92|nr:HAD family hydrolase [Nitriliruptor alkaliphilus]